jgi:hypothetical protein
MVAVCHRHGGNASDQRSGAAGILEGEQKAKLETAKNLKAAGLTKVQIKAATRLTATDLERL